MDLARRELNASQIRPNMQMCRLLILGEDHRLAWHPGVDPLALCRAAWRTYGRGRREGGSTVAMQLVRVLTGKFDRAWRRKADEMALALLVTRHVPRVELPALYLSVGYYGWRMNGFAQACRRLVIDPACCTLHESAMLVARLKYPQPRDCSAARWQQISDRSGYLMMQYGRDRITLDGFNVFRMKPPLAALRCAYPKAEDLLQALALGSRERAVVARLWVSEGIPFAFRECPALYEEARTWLAKQLGLDPKEISLTGSGRLGYSLAPQKWGDAYDPLSSDLDVFAVSERLFDALREDFERWRGDYQSGKIIARSNRERRYWSQNLKWGGRNITRGFLDSWKVPNRPTAYPVASRIKRLPCGSPEKIAEDGRRPDSSEKADFEVLHGLAVIRASGGYHLDGCREAEPQSTALTSAALSQLPRKEAGKNLGRSHGISASCSYRDR